MGNRALITLQFNTKKSNCYYVHWNGGLDTILPMFKAIDEVKKETQLLPTCEEIEAAFFEFSQQKMELQTSEECSKWIEENGHYFINLSKMIIIHKFEKLNKKTDIYDILSDIYIPSNCETVYTNTVMTYREEYRQSALAEYPERIKLFKDSFLKLMVDRIEAEKKLDEKLKLDAKKTWKKIILDELKELGLSSIAKKIVSVTSEHYSGGSSVNINTKNLFKSEYKTLKELTHKYKYGRFDGMTDCYEYFEDSVKTAKKASYISIYNEFSDDIKEKVKQVLVSKGIDSDEKANAIDNCTLATLIYRKLNELENETIE